MGSMEAGVGEQCKNCVADLDETEMRIPCQGQVPQQVTTNINGVEATMSVMICGRRQHHSAAQGSGSLSVKDVFNIPDGWDE